MPLNKKQLLDRLELMFWLPDDWDGFGSPPITKKVLDVSKQMIDYVEVDVDMKIFVGVEPEGSLFCDIRRPADKLCRLELVVLPEGTLEYTDYREFIIISEGAFLLTYETINDILR